MIIAFPPRQVPQRHLLGGGALERVQSRRRGRRLLIGWLSVCTALACLWASCALDVPAEAKGFGAYLVDVKPEEVFPGADRFGPNQGTPPAMAAYKGDQLVGYVFATSDTGYSGKPVRLLVG